MDAGSVRQAQAFSDLRCSNEIGWVDQARHGRFRLTRVPYMVSTAQVLHPIAYRQTSEPDTHNNNNGPTEERANNQRQAVSREAAPIARSGTVMRAQLCICVYECATTRTETGTGAGRFVPSCTRTA